MWAAVQHFISGLVATLLLIVTPLLHATSFFPHPCDQPLHYSIEQIDPRFQTNDAEVKEAAGEAEALWENALHRDLFQYDPIAPFTIHFTYDDRQKRTQEEELLQEERNTLESSNEHLSDAGYNQAKAAYQKALADYQAQVTAYNQAVEQVNKNGGANKAEYDKLQNQQQELKDLYQDVEKKRQAVNTEANRFNSTATKQKEAIGEFNQSVETFQERYGGARQFDQGVYDGKGITIFQFADHDQLVLVLAHELGHALGLGHVDDPQALMYYLMDKQNVLSVGLTEADIAAAKAVCPTL